MNADGLCQISLTTINADLAYVPEKSDIAKHTYVYAYMCGETERCYFLGGKCHQMLHQISGEQRFDCPVDTLGKFLLLSGLVKKKKPNIEDFASAPSSSLQFFESLCPCKCLSHRPGQM